MEQGVKMKPKKYTGFLSGTAGFEGCVHLSPLKGLGVLLRALGSKVVYFLGGVLLREMPKWYTGTPETHLSRRKSVVGVR